MKHKVIIQIVSEDLRTVSGTLDSSIIESIWDLHNRCALLECYNTLLESFKTDNI